MAGLWHREVALVGAYAYGIEESAGSPSRRTFDLAFDLVRSAGLGRLVSATYPLERFEEAIAHAGAAGRRGAVKIAFDMRNTRSRPMEERTCRMSPRPGFVLDVDRSTPPTLFWHGEGYRLERLPADRSRVVYAPEPLDGLADPVAAIRLALKQPVGDSAPLSELLFAGMRLTIAFDDISLPLPPMQRPDVRELVIEQVLDMAAAAGVDDVVLVAALALHRRMTEEELRHALGDRIYDAFAPEGLLTQHDAEDPDNLIHLGTTDLGEDVELNKRAATSDLLVYVNINLVAMDGGHKSVATGLASYRSLRHHHNARHDAGLAELHGPAPLGTALLELANGPSDRRVRSEGLSDRDDPQHEHLSGAVPIPAAPRVGMDTSRTGQPSPHRRLRWNALPRVLRARSCNRSALRSG